MGLAQPGDKFLVNRNDQAQVLLQENLMAEIQDTDYMLVNRGDVTHKITGADVIDSFIPDMFITEVKLSDYSPETEQTISVTIDAGGGAPPYTVERVWGYRVNADSEDLDLVTAAGPSFTIPTGFVEMQLYCRVTMTDSRGTSITKQSEYTDPVVLSESRPILNTVSLTKTTSGARFTSQEFQIDTDFANNGVPASNKYLTAWVDGNFLSTIDLSPIVEYKEVSLGQRFLTNHPGGLIAPNGGALEDSIYKPDVNYTYALPGGGREHTAIPQSNNENELYYIQFDLPEPIDFSERNTYIYTSNGVVQRYQQPLFYWRAGVGEGRYDLYVSDDIVGQGNYRLLFSNRNSAAFTGSVNADSGYSSTLYSVRWQQVWDPNSRNEDGINRGPAAPAIYIAFFGSSAHYPWALPREYGGPGNYIAGSGFKPTLVFQDSTNFDKLNLYDIIYENGGDGLGEIVEIDAANSTLVLSRMSPWEQLEYDADDPWNHPDNPEWDPGRNHNSLANHSWQAGNTVSTQPRPDPAARQYLLFSADENVIDVTTDTVAPVNMTNTENPTFNLKFPATFPSGQAPDDELLDGTELTVSLYAENSVGRSLDVQDSLVPGTAFAALTAAEKREIILQQSTYEIRRSAQQKTLIIQELLNQGFTQAEIDAAIA